MMPQRNQGKDRATAASIWFEIWGVVDPGKKNSISTGKFPKNVKFFRQFYKRISSFAGKFPKILIFSGNLKNSIFQAKNCPFTATSAKIILFIFKSNHFRTYFLYMIRYNNISRLPRLQRPPCDPPCAPPAQNLGVATLSPQK